MQELKRRVRVILSLGLAILLAGSYPVATFAQVAPETITTTTVAPAAEPTYTYDAKTGHWNTDNWQYDPTSGQYDAVVQPTAPVAPVNPTTTAEPTTTAPASTATTSPTDTTTKASSDKSGTIDSTTNIESNTDITNNNQITNNANATSLSGDAAVIYNTEAGNATSGDASATETIMNTINSSVGAGAGGIANFVADISGDVHGDILLYPMILAALLAQSALSPTTVNQTTNVTANTTIDTDNQITNNIDLSATSGSALVTGNTSAGDATTGSADTVANVMNIINSIVAANQSFIGLINIYGNLDGDILISPDFMSQLLASNGGSTVNQTVDASLDVNSQNTQSIANNVNLSATSGAATVADNTIAGNATSGAADTNLVILNMTGHEVVASNSLLVFVNVLGKWVGLIVDAPAGTTAAALGDDVDRNTVLNLDGTLTSQNNAQITNNINLASQSGDATVSGNTQAGNATSGNATASANILNMATSSLDLSGWFGVLFINVFGSWLGSFGVDTSAGSQVPVTSNDEDKGQVIPSVATSSSAPTQAIRFAPKVASVATDTPTRYPILSIAKADDSLTQSTLPVDDESKSVVLGSASSLSATGEPTSPSANNPMLAAAAAMGALLLAAAAGRGLWPIIARKLS